MAQDVPRTTKYRLAALRAFTGHGGPISRFAIAVRYQGKPLACVDDPRTRRTPVAVLHLHHLRIQTTFSGKLRRIDADGNPFANTSHVGRIWPMSLLHDVTDANWTAGPKVVAEERHIQINIGDRNEV